MAASLFPRRGNPLTRSSLAPETAAAKRKRVVSRHGPSGQHTYASLYEQRTYFLTSTAYSSLQVHLYLRARP